MPEVESVRELLERTPYVTVRDLPDDGIEFIIDARRDTNWQTVPLNLVLGLVFVAVGWFMRGRWSDVVPPAASWVLIGLGALNLGIAWLLAVMLSTGGPPRDIVLRARPGHLHADRSVAGDRVVSEYTADDALCLVVEGNALFIQSRRGMTPLVAFGEREVHKALAMLLASSLWQPAVLWTATGSQSGIEQWVIAPDRAAEPTAPPSPSPA